MDTEFKEHFSVMKQECLHYLSEALVEKNCDTPIFLDCTFGRGGHSLALAELFPRAQIWATDQDPDAYRHGQELISSKKLSERIHLQKMNFCDYPSWHKDQGKKADFFDGILLDLGVSSHQFDEGSRGFSFRFDAPLDMRMAYDDDSMMSAKDIVNEFSKEELTQIFSDYGEDKFARNIALRIVEKRKEKPIETTKELENIIFHAYPASMRFGKIHPATRVFQALRISVNKELLVLEKALPDLFSLLSPGGRLAVISFHSLEDRIVKNVFKNLKAEAKDKVKILTKKPLTPQEDEIKINSRSRSAKLRVIERI